MENRTCTSCGYCDAACLSWLGYSAYAPHGSFSLDHYFPGMAPMCHLNLADPWDVQSAYLARYACTTTFTYLTVVSCWKKSNLRPECILFGILCRVPVFVIPIPVVALGSGVLALSPCRGSTRSRELHPCVYRILRFAHGCLWTLPIAAASQNQQEFACLGQ